MSIGQLRWELFWRMSMWGVLEGATCGAAYGTILLFRGTMFGGLIGGGMGLILGILTGLHLSGVTVERYLPLDNFEDYRRITSVQCALVSGLGVVIMMTVLTFVVFHMQALVYVPFCLIIPALIAVVASVLATRRVTGWYKMNANRVRPQPRPVDAWE